MLSTPEYDCAITWDDETPCITVSYGAHKGGFRMAPEQAVAFAMTMLTAAGVRIKSFELGEPYTRHASQSDTDGLMRFLTDEMVRQNLARKKSTTAKARGPH